MLICLTSIVMFGCLSLINCTKNLKKNFDEDLMLIVKKKLLSDVIFDTLPFRVYDHFFNCNRGFYVLNKCNFCTRFHVKEKALSDFLNEELMFNYGLLPRALLKILIF